MWGKFFDWLRPKYEKPEVEIKDDSYPRSAANIKIVYAPIGYIEAGIKIMQKIKDRHE